MGKIRRLGARCKTLITVTIFVAAISGMPVVSSTLTHAVADASSAQGGQFVPVQGRILDTRSATSVGGYSTPMPQNGWRTVQVTGEAGVPSAGVAAVAVNFSVLNATANGYVKADKDEATPNSTISYMFWLGGQPQSNSGVVAVGTDGKIQVMASSSTDLMIDVQGYYTSGAPAPGGFVPVPESRIVDTRNGTGLPNAKIASGTTSTVQIAGAGGIPNDASAVMLNFLVENQTGTGRLALYPADQPAPQQFLHFDSSVPDATSSAIALSTTGSPIGAIKVKVYLDSGGAADLVVDVLGYFTATHSGGAFTPTAQRVYDSRSGSNSPLGSTPQTIQVAGVSGVPSSDVVAVAVNVEIFDGGGTHGGWTHVWPDDQLEPNPSMAVQYDPGGSASNLMTVGVGADGGITIRNLGADVVDFAVDVEGYFVDTSHLDPVSLNSLCATDTSSQQCPAEESLSVSTTTTPTLHAMTVGPDGSTIAYMFQVFATDSSGNLGAQPIASGSASGSSGSDVRWLVPSGTLNDGQLYAYEVEASLDGQTYSPWSAASYFVETLSSAVSTTQVADDSTSTVVSVGNTNPMTAAAAADGGFSCTAKSHYVTLDTYSTATGVLLAVDATYYAQISCTKRIAESMTAGSTLNVNGSQVDLGSDKECDLDTDGHLCAYLHSSGGYYCGRGEGCAGTYNSSGVIDVSLGGSYYFKSASGACKLIGGNTYMLCTPKGNAKTVYAVV